MIQREDVVDVARTLIGTPFRHMACLPGVGIDCLNVIGYVGTKLGVEGSTEWGRDEELRVYNRAPQRPDLLLRKCDELLRRISLAEIGIGDILVIAFKVFPQHFAIVSQTDPMYGIHAYPLPPLNKVVESRMPPAMSKIVRAYRYHGVAE